MNANNTVEKMRHMRMDAMAGLYHRSLTENLYKDYTLDDYLTLLIDTEWESRQGRKIDNLMRAAAFKQTASAADIDYMTVRNLDKNVFERLLGLDFLKRKENLIIVGKTGCGKSYLAQSLGVRACELLHRTLYFHCSHFFDQGRLTHLDGSYPRFFKRLQKAELLIIDDFGLASIDKEARSLLMDVIEDRYDRMSTIITSQIPVTEWHPLFGDGIMADAILDRIVYSSHRIELNGESLRKKKRLK